MDSRPAGVLLTLALSWLLAPAASPQDPAREQDGRVRKFLEDARGRWRDMNVPYAARPSTTSS